MVQQKSMIVTSEGNLREVIQTLDESSLGPHEILIHQTKIGVNMLDYQYTRFHANKLKQDPSQQYVPGCEAIGEVMAVGKEVKHINPDDKIMYVSTKNYGAYTSHRIIPAQHAIKLNTTLYTKLTDSMIIGTLLKGLVAHMLIFDAAAIISGNSIIVYSAAGGVGGILCQIANHYEQYVIGAVGGEAKFEMAEYNKCHAIIDYNADDFVPIVQKLTNNFGVPVIYDSVGGNTIFKSLECLSQMGILLSYGFTRGNYKIDNLSLLRKKNAYLTYPSFSNYKESDMNRLIMATHEILNWLDADIVTPYVTEYSLSDANKCMNQYEKGSNTGSFVLSVE